MTLWEWLADSAGVILALAALGLLALFVRRRLLTRNGGTFELSHRVRPGQGGRGWVLGLGRYEGNLLQWFRIFSFRPTPHLVWQREDLQYLSTREPTSAEAVALFGGHVVVVCTLRGGSIDLAMSPDALTGFQSWLEASPPGSGLPT